MTHRFVLALGLLMALATSVAAQTGSVSGTVLDESGAVVPGATVTLTGPGAQQTRFTDQTGVFRFTGVAAGTYVVAISLSGFSTQTRGGVSVASANVEIPAVTLALANVGESLVVSATRVETTLLNAPATMTVLTPDVLTAGPAQNYGDLLRSVPGTNVIQMSARDVNITSRQATSTLASSQLALLDGRSIYLDFFGMVIWDFVPTNPEEIKQIEVVRGPASAVWGANALSGVVNIITKSPRETPGATSVVFGGGYLDRDAGSGAGKGAGATYRADVSTSQVVNDVWSYRISAGYFNSDAFARPTGVIPVIADPRDPTGQTTVGGATYPADGDGAFGSAFSNRGTSQPKFDVRVDQELANGRVTYAGGVAGSSGTIYTGIGPFDIQDGSTMSYAKMNYTRGAVKFNVFTNIVDAEAPNLLVADATTGRPLQLNFKTATYDVEFGHSKLVGRRNGLSYGGNYRRNNFDITLAPQAQDRNEIGAYFQDEIFVGQFRFSLGGRVDKFGNIDDAVFSPRLTLVYQPTATHSFRVGFNRGFRSPSTINNYLDITLFIPVDLRGLAPLLPPPLQPQVATPFPLAVRAVGSEIPIGGKPQAPLKEESLTAYEVAYTGVVGNDTTLGVAFYVNDTDDNINFVQLPATLDPYTPEAPPPGWPLPPAILALMAQRGILLPRTAFTYLNLGPLRQKGVELSIDHRFSATLTAFANYSWQSEPRVLDDPNPYPTTELALPPTNRFNIGTTYNGPRFLGSASVNYTDRAFWSDVLTSAYHGFTDSFALVNGSFGVKWAGGRVITSVKGNNLFNETLQQHVFGDIIRRSVMGEVRLSF